MKKREEIPKPKAPEPRYIHENGRDTILSVTFWFIILILVIIIFAMT